MDNEKYGIELELITNKFKEKMQEVKSAFSSLTDKKVNLNANTAQIEYLKKQIGELTADLQVNAKTKFWNETETLKAQAQLEKLTNQYNSLIAKQNEVAVSSTKSSQNIVKGLDKMTSKIKRFGLSLLSIRSIWALVSRASSAYLTQNTELSNRLQSVWAGLGALLSPIIEGIVNILAKAVKYIAIFIKALTGVDLLARATAKSMNGTAKSAKALNKALAGFDELTNLDTEAGGGTAGALGGIADLNKVKVDTGWADKIQTFGNWVKTNWPTVLSLLFGVVTFFKLLNPLMTVFGTKVGILKALGIGLMVAGIVKTIGSLLKYLQDPTWENFGNIIKGIGLFITGLGLAFLGLPAIVLGVVTLITGYVIQNWDKIREYLQMASKWLTDKADFIKEKFGSTVGIVYDYFVRTFNRIVLVFDNLFTSIKGIFDGIIKFVKGVFTGNLQMAFDGIKQIFSNLFRAISGTFNIIMDGLWDKIVTIASVMGDIIWGVFRSLVNNVLSKLENFLNTPIRAINTLISAISTLSGRGISRLNTFSFPRLDVGTNYVPQDQVAMIHKGEAVIPKKFNSKEYFGGTNDETNSILERVIEAIENIEINPYTTIKDVGKASLSYINGKSRQLGESVVR